MQSEDLDKKIRDAADNHHPAYNEKAWSKMEDLLNTHLPVKEKERRRGFILLILTLVLLGGGTWLYLDRPWYPSPGVANNSSKGVAKKTGNAATPGIGKQEQPGITGEASEPVKVPEGNVPTETTSNSNSILSNKTTYLHNNRLTNTDAFDVTVSAPSKAKRTKKQAVDLRADSEKQLVDDMNVTAGVFEPPTAKKTETDQVVNQQVNELKNSNPDKLTTTEISSPPSQSTNAEKQDNPIESIPEEINRDKSNAAVKKVKENGFAISFSAGPDISAVGADDWGRVQPVYGVGIAYTFAGGFTVRTGFYTASKIYTSKPDEYKNSYSFPNYNYLEKIDADCRVYEIPVTLAYSFGASKKHNWFASTGLSSYIMKRESYDYVYKYPNGSSYTHESTYHNENTNLFSVLSLSGGYTRKLSNTFSLSAEPYMKLPLTGVGEGSVQLNSLGVLFTISAKLKPGKR